MDSLKSRCSERPSHLKLPDYKPISLRWPFFAFLFLYVCTLITLLEYGLHILPVVEDRISGFRPQTADKSRHAGSTIETTMPSAVVIANTSTLRRRKPSAVSENVSATLTSEVSSFTSTPAALSDPANSSASAAAAVSSAAPALPMLTEVPKSSTSSQPHVRPTSFPAWNYQRPNHTSTYSLGLPPAVASVLIANRPEPWRYAQLRSNSVLVNYVLAFQWTHGPDNFLATPVPPGADVGDRCVKHNLMGWVTHDPDDCPVLIPLNIWNDAKFTGEFGPLHGGPAFLDADCRKYDNDQVALLSPYWGMPDCWLDEERSRTIYRFSKTTGPGDIVTTTTARVVAGPDGEPVTLVEQITLGGDVVTSTTRLRGDTSPVPGVVVTTLTDSLGRPTAIITSFPSGFSRRLTPATLRDSAGRPTATTWEYEALEARPVTLTDDHGVPTATSTEYYLSDGLTATTDGVFPSGPDPHGSVGDHVVFFGPLSRAAYFAGSFAPVLFCTLLAILLKVMHADMQALLPFHALTRPGGAPTADSLCLAPGGVRGPLASWRQLYRFGDPIPLLGDALVLLSTLAVSLSSEAVGVALAGDCAPDNFFGCSLSLAVVSAPARAAEAVLVAIAGLVAVAGILTCRWRTGVSASPWSIVGIAALLPRSEKTLLLLQALDPVKGTNRSLCAEEEELSSVRLALDYYPEADGVVDGAAYSILTVPPNGEKLVHRLFDKTQNSRSASVSRHCKRQPSSRRPLVVKHLTRLLFLGILCGFLALILVYENTRNSDAFEQFMDGQNFGSGFLFTTMGTVVALFWDGFYSCKRTREICCISLFVSSSSEFSIFFKKWPLHGLAG